MPRLDRGKYSAALMMHTATQRRALEYWIARSSRATTVGIKKAGSRPAALDKISCLNPVPGRSAAPPGLESYFLKLLLLGFLRLLRLFRLLRFLSHSILSRFKWMETRHEACSAEGQPHNILEHNPSRFAARCPAPSRQCHRVIHRCYAIWACFSPREALANRILLRRERSARCHQPRQG